MGEVADYFSSLRDLRFMGAQPERSGYPVLKALLDASGKDLKPAVRCVTDPAQARGDMPDVALYEASQWQRQSSDLPAGARPDRGVIEVKRPELEVEKIAETSQVQRYLDNFGVVLVTNYRDFVLLDRTHRSCANALERLTLASTTAAWQEMLRHPLRSEGQWNLRLTSFLQRMLQTNVPLTEPSNVAWYLASFAREAKALLANQTNDELAPFREALESALGIRFQADQKGREFFQASLIQTLFYGLFSAFVIWHRRGAPGTFDWRSTSYYLDLPVIAALFHEAANPIRLRELGLDDILDRVTRVLARIDRPAFFSRWQDTEAVQYFYEPFLQAYDANLRKDLGVWYTPREIVRYQVERVDRLLRSELGRPRGLADPDVTVLDPCCGTGAYLVEVLRRIAKTLDEEGAGATLGMELLAAARDRILGFEILTAPFVIAHLQVGLLLAEFGTQVPAKQRAGIYLTNALTGWRPPDEEGKQRVTQALLGYTELQREHDAADKVKQGRRIMVVLGNPPYNAYAGVTAEEEKELDGTSPVDVYKGVYFDAKGKRRYRLSDSPERGGWGIRKFNLDDLYVRFFRLAEKCIAEAAGTGIVSFISNYSWTSETSFVVLRERLLSQFDHLWIENMHGNRKISEYSPDGRTSETVFAMKGFSPGIQQGVVVSTWVRKAKRNKGTIVEYRDDLDDAKAEIRRARLLESLATDCTLNYLQIVPTVDTRFSFRSSSASTEYLSWPSITELAKEWHNGLMEKRGGALIDIERQPLIERMEAYFDESLTWDELIARYPIFPAEQSRYDGPSCRKKVLQIESFDESRIAQYIVRPFDVRNCYWSGVRPLWNEPRPTLIQTLKGNRWCILTRPKCVSEPEGIPLYFTPLLSDNDALRGHSYVFPFVSYINDAQEPNVSSASLDYAESLLNGSTYAEREVFAAELFLHVIAVAHSSNYLTENSVGIASDWLRVPLPKYRDSLSASSALGRTVANLLNTEVAIPGVTTGHVRPELKPVGRAVLRNAEGEEVKEQIQESNLTVTAGWGTVQGSGIVMPGRGRVEERPTEPTEGWPWTEVVDIWLNDRLCLRDIPREAWEFRIGGYQVMKKWLSYREMSSADKPILGRPLRLRELQYLTNMARRLSALVLLEPELDKNYEAVRRHTYAWPRPPTTA